MPKRVRLDITQKHELIQRLEAGESVSSLATKYGIHEDSVRRINRQSSKLLNVESDLMNKRKSLRRPADCELDSRLYSWFAETRAAKLPVSGPILREKALSLNAELGSDPNFMASRGWMQRFMKRHGLHFANESREKVSADDTSAESYLTQLQNIIETEDYSREDIYNMDESDLFWRSLPRKTLALCSEKKLSGHGVKMDRITVVFCANASGTHRLPLFVIGESQNPRCFKHVKNSLPVVYRGQSSAWMDSNFFEDWFCNVFKPEVETFQMLEGRSGKVLLLTDNFSAHKVSLADQSGENFAIRFLPEKTTSLIQPMDQGVIMKVKRIFQKKMMSKLLTFPSIQSFFLDYDLKDCVDMAAGAWSELSQENLSQAWNKLLPNSNLKHETNCPYTAEEDGTEELRELLSAVQGDITCEDVREWLQELDGLQPAEGDTILPVGDAEDDVNQEEVKAAIEVLQKWSKRQPETVQMQVDCVSDYFHSV